ncbi:glycosyltransferase family 4 protein [Clostridiaceae bacterium 35-E11]
MNVYIIRNAEVYSNANMIRIIEALHSNFDLSIISRVRESKTSYSRKGIYSRNKFTLNKNEFDNYEIHIKSEMGKGLKNIIQLLTYEMYLFITLLIKRKDIDIIHAFDLDCGLASILFSKIFKKKVVYHIADFYVDSRPGIPNKLKNIVKKLEYCLIEKADSVIICTEKRVEQIKGSKPKRLSIIHNVPISNLDLVNSKIEMPLDLMKTKKVSIGYVGGLSKIHFTKEILNAIKSKDDVFLNIAGYGDLASYVNEISKACPHIKYYGRIEYNSAMLLYSHSDLMLMIYDPSVPNHKYSAPNKIYEAMMLGKAIIVVNNTGIDEIVRNENMGLVIEFTEEALSYAINYIVNNPNELEKMKRNAKNAYKKFSWEEMRARIISVYEEL